MSATDFKPGDRVRLTAHLPKHFDGETHGIVSEDPTMIASALAVTIGGRDYLFAPRDLTLDPLPRTTARPFQIGDPVRLLTPQFPDIDGRSGVVTATSPLVGKWARVEFPSDGSWADELLARDGKRSALFPTHELEPITVDQPATEDLDATNPSTGVVTAPTPAPVDDNWDAMADAYGPECAACEGDDDASHVDGCQHIAALPSLVELDQRDELRTLIAAAIFNSAGGTGEPMDSGLTFKVDPFMAADAILARFEVKAVTS